MTLLSFFAFLAAGHLWTWLLQTSGLTRPLWQSHPKLTEVAECDLCLGFWVYLGLGLLRKDRKTTGLWAWSVETVILAGVSAFVMHLIRLGWTQKFGIVYD